MEESLRQPPSAAPEIRTATHTVPWKIILPISIVVAALLSGGGVYLWQQNVKNSAVKDVTSQLTALQGEKTAENSTALTAAQDEIKKLKSDFLAESIRLILSQRNRGEYGDVFQDPNNSMAFYYVGKGSSNSTSTDYLISRYDASKDEAYLKDRDLKNFVYLSTILYEERLPKQELDGIEAPFLTFLQPLNLVGNQLVFYHMDAESSPGPCWSAWTDPSMKLYAVDITQTPPLKRTPFVMSSALRLQKETEQKQCSLEM